MGYEVHYGIDRKSVSQKGNRSVLTWMFFGLFLIMVWGFWPEGREVLGRMLWFGDGENTVLAAETFAQSLQCGLSLHDAVELFCLQVLNGAGLGG